VVGISKAGHASTPPGPVLFRTQPWKSESWRARTCHTPSTTWWLALTLSWSWVSVGKA